jgi:hypothetical protein
MAIFAQVFGRRRLLSGFRAQQFIRLQAVSQTGKNVLRMPG